MPRTPVRRVGRESASLQPWVPWCSSCNRVLGEMVRGVGVVNYLGYYKKLGPIAKAATSYVQGRRGGGTVKGGPHGFAIERDECPLRELCDRLGPGQKALLEALWIEPGKHPAKGIVRGNSMRQDEEGLEPGALALAKEFPILEAFPPGQQGTHSDDQDIEQMMLLRPLNAWVL